MDPSNNTDTPDTPDTQKVDNEFAKLGKSLTELVSREQEYIESLNDFFRRHGREKIDEPLSIGDAAKEMLAVLPKVKEMALAYKEVSTLMRPLSAAYDAEIASARRECRAPELPAAALELLNLLPPHFLWQGLFAYVGSVDHSLGEWEQRLSGRFSETPDNGELTEEQMEMLPPEMRELLKNPPKGMKATVKVIPLSGKNGKDIDIAGILSELFKK
jgi:hypothetical protein